MKLAVLSPREASIFACLCETIVAPQPALPDVRDTAAVAFFDRWLARSPRPNRVALRALLYLVELAPLAVGFRARLRRLDDADRGRVLARLELVRSPQVRQLVKLVRGMAALAYYGDDHIMLRLGYDAEANVERGRALRVAEARP